MISIWFPVVNNFSYKTTSIDPVTLEASKNYPLSSQAEIIESLSIGALTGGLQNPKKILHVTQSLKQGILNLPNMPIFKSSSPFNEKLVFASHSSWQLQYNGFVVPNALLSAYDISGDTSYLAMAKEFMLDWAEFEKKQWLPRGFIWNDHAIASRAIVMASFWYRYKQSTIFNTEDAKKILELVTSTAKLLQNDKLYTYKTNHGTMQNLALLKLAIYFPKLTNMQSYKNNALERIDIQFDYFINSEGVVLEHSAEYHEFGVNLLHSTIKLLTASSIDIPERLKVLYANSSLVLEKLYRSDHSLPAIGDTLIGPGKLLTPSQKSPQSNHIEQTLLQKAGYAIWRTNLPAHLAISWAYNTNMGHKHPDELSINLWQASQNIITNVGYWPYKRADRKKAINWQGSNAPHLENERFSSNRKTHILSTGNSKNTRFIELLREEASGFKVNRQIFQIKSNQWLVLDSFEDSNPNRLSKTIWTLDSSLFITDQKQNQFKLSSNKTNKNINISFLSSQGTNIAPIYGNKESLIGWNATKDGIQPAVAFSLKQPSKNTWSIMSLTGVSDSKAGEINMSYWKNNSNWRISGQDSFSITRNNNNIQIETTGVESEKLTLTKIPEVAQNAIEANKSFLLAKNIYGKPLKPLIRYRNKISSLILVLALLVSISYIVIKIGKIKKIQFNYLVSISWGLVSLWVHLIYFN